MTENRMKKSFLFAFLFITLAASSQGYEIKFTFKPFKNQFVYLGHYEGKQLPIIDSVKVDANSNGVFKGTKKLGQGVYLLGYPNKMGFFEFLVGDDQQFAIKADTMDLRNVNFVGSPENDVFVAYQKYMGVKGKTIDSLQQILKATSNTKDSAAIQAKIKALNKEVNTYRSEAYAKNPNNIIGTIMKLLQEPEVPPASKQPGGKYDSLYAFQYVKQHYWDGLPFYDDKMLRTPVFENKLDKYMNNMVYLNPDSTIKELDWMLGYSSAAPQLQKYLLMKFVNRYLNMKYMWEDAVYLHLYEKYFNNKNYDWLTDKGKKIIQERAFNLMANILGKEAAEIELPDTAGKKLSLYKAEAPYTVVIFWDPKCGHCQETLPKIKTMYDDKWKAMGVKIFAVAKETDGTQKDWTDFIHKHNLEGWNNVYYSKAEDNARVSAGNWGYSQLYDVSTFPTLYLLDKDKRIVAKKLTYEQIDEVLGYKIKGQN